jgi:hypothetical protein
MNRFKDVQLLRDLAPITLPPFNWIQIYNLSSEVLNEVDFFLTHSLGQPSKLDLNNGALLDGREWVGAILKALPKVKKTVELCRFSFTKEHVEEIVDNSHHLEYLGIRWCKLRKYLN